ncbi:MAG TPA: nucleoside triphosphate pyrophosphohydrolase [Acidobacteriota bacterium]|nr:nucleoside triphosphate pyrophosphohydrolase [Acidobacteriota bacterium]
MPDSYWPKLIKLMDTLRGPEGCPWDVEQTRETLKPMLIEEAYEVLEALDGDDPDELCEELGDLLFQVIFNSRIAKERGEFDAEDVCRRIYEKMVGRHPHVFGNESFADSQELLKNWEDLKAAEKKASGRQHQRQSLLDGIPDSLPAMYKTNQVSAKASRVGFDWPDLKDIGEKLAEEFAELQAAAESGDEARVQEEVGDLLFAALNVSRYLQIDPETALNRANGKFSRRFKAMEEHFAAQGRALKDVELDEMEAVWQSLKTKPEIEETHQETQ